MTRYTLEDGNGAEPLRSFCPDGWEWDLDLGRCVQVDDGDDGTTSDDSFLFISDAVWATPDQNTVEVAYSLENNITSGNGKTLTGTSIVTVDGTEEYRSTRTVSPGEKAPENVRISGLSAGTHEVCIKDDEQTGTGICQDVTVEGVDFDPFAFEVTSCPTPSTRSPGESFTLDVEIQNNNSVSGTVPVVVQGRPPDATGNQDNVTLGSAEATISGNSTSTVSVDVSAPDDTGDWGLIAYTTEASQA